jgi:MscS family membrane protein
MFELWEWNGFFLGHIILAVFIFIVAILFHQLFARVVLKQLEKLTTKMVIDDEIFTALEPPLKFAFVVMGFYLAILMLNLPTNIEGILTQFVRSLLMFSLFWGLYYSIEPLSFIIDKLTATTSSVSLNGFKSLLTDRAQLTEGIKSIFVKSSKILIVLIGLMAFLNEWGINIIALLASLGVAGAAVALAAKDMISNSLSSLTIIFDKPFKQGDWIMTSDVEGIVEEIGSRTTKIRTSSEAVVTIPNAMLSNSAVTNWSKITHKRIKMRINLETRTRREQITRIIQRIRDYLQKHPDIETDPFKVTTLVHLFEFNENSIDILLDYFTKTTHLQEWMRIREENMLEFMRIVEDEGANFAYPSQQIYMEKRHDEFPKT